MGKINNKKKNKDVRLNKTLLITGIIFVISGIFALTIILNKGVIFGKRLIGLSKEASQIPLHSIQVTPDSNYLKNVGDTTNLRIYIDGKEVTGTGVYELSCSNESAITIDGDSLKSTALGNATITARSIEYDVEGTATVNVVVPANKLSVTCEEDTIKVDGTCQIEHTTRPTEATGVQVILDYSSSDNSIATVDMNGVVKGVSKGKVTITATDKITGFSDTCNITVE